MRYIIQVKKLENQLRFVEDGLIPWTFRPFNVFRKFYSTAGFVSMVG